MERRTGRLRILAALLLITAIGAGHGRQPAAPLPRLVQGELTESGSPYLAAGTVTIPAGRTLTVTAGAVILCRSGARIEVYGTLVCKGEILNVVKFSAADSSAGPGAWDGIYFYNQEARGDLSNCVIEYAVAGVYCQSGARVTLDNNLIRHHSMYGVYAGDASEPVIVNNLIQDCAYGIACYDNSGPVIAGNTILDHRQAGIYCFINSSPFIEKNVVSACQGPGIYCLDHSDPRIQGNLVAGCANGIAVTNSAPRISHNSINANRYAGVICYGSRPEIRYNNIFNQDVYNVCALGPDSLQLSDNWWGIGQPDPRKIRGPVMAYSFLLSPFNIAIEQPKAIARMELRNGKGEPVQRVCLGDEITIRVVGVDGSATTQDHATVMVRNTASDKIIHELFLAETECNSGVYTGTITVGFGMYRQQAPDKENFVTIYPRMNRTRRQEVCIVNQRPAVSNFTIVSALGRGRVAVDQPPQFFWTFTDPDVVPQPQTSFQIELSGHKDFKGKKTMARYLGNSSISNFIFPGLKMEPGRRYYARVRVKDYQSWSEWKTLSFAANTRPAAPKPVFPLDGMTLDAGLWPSLISAAPVDPDADTLEYRYELYRDRAMQQPLARGIGTQKHMYHIWQALERLEENGTYWWRVCVHDGYEQSDWSELQHFCINLVDEPIQPFGLEYPGINSAVACENLMFKWEPTADPDPHEPVTYTLWLSTDQEFTNKMVISHIPSSSYQMTVPLNYGCVYYWKVKAVSETGGFQWCNTSTRPAFSFMVSPGQIASCDYIE